MFKVGDRVVMSDLGVMVFGDQAHGAAGVVSELGSWGYTYGVRWDFLNTNILGYDGDHLEFVSLEATIDAWLEKNA